MEQCLLLHVSGDRKGPNNLRRAYSTLQSRSYTDNRTLHLPSRTTSLSAEGLLDQTRILMGIKRCNRWRWSFEQHILWKIKATQGCKRELEKSRRFFTRLSNAIPSQQSLLD